MPKIIKSALKYLLISVATTALFGVLSYFIRNEVDIKNLACFSLVLFICYCLIALAAPRLRKLFGYKAKK